LLLVVVVVCFVCVQVIACPGPYPMLVRPCDGGFWVKNGEYETAYGKDGVWRASEISTEHYTIQADKTSSVYGRYFKTQVCACGRRLGGRVFGLVLWHNFEGSKSF